MTLSTVGWVPAPVTWVVRDGRAPQRGVPRHAVALAHLFALPCMVADGDALQRHPAGTAHYHLHVHLVAVVVQHARARRGRYPNKARPPTERAARLVNDTGWHLGHIDGGVAAVIELAAVGDAWPCRALRHRRRRRRRIIKAHVDDLQPATATPDSARPPLRLVRHLPDAVRRHRGLRAIQPPLEKCDIARLMQQRRRVLHAHRCCRVLALLAVLMHHARVEVLALAGNQPAPPQPAEELIVLVAPPPKGV
mmetsp:Transcript_8086/g.26637  ORF Transcript_8086/g.26637 Transcript_8086/m.26637 type:complete len:251 (+) Transcript_8086:235-987(+)